MSDITLHEESAEIRETIWNGMRVRCAPNQPPKVSDDGKIWEAIECKEVLEKYITKAAPLVQAGIPYTTTFNGEKKALEITPIPLGEFYNENEST